MKARVRTSAVVVHNDSLLTFFAIDPHDGREFHFLPGGEIEMDETAPEAAIRETFEETGYEIEINSKSCIDRDYNFFWNGEDYHVLTFFYRGYLTNPFQKPASVKDADYNKEVRWIPIKDVQKIFAYQEDILKAILDLVS